MRLGRAKDCASDFDVEQNSKTPSPVKMRKHGKQLLLIHQFFMHMWRDRQIDRFIDVSILHFACHEFVSKLRALYLHRFPTKKSIYKDTSIQGFIFLSVPCPHNFGEKILKFLVFLCNNGTSQLIFWFPRGIGQPLAALLLPWRCCTWEKLRKFRWRRRKWRVTLKWESSHLIKYSFWLLTKENMMCF